MAKIKTLNELADYKARKELELLTKLRAIQQEFMTDTTMGINKITFVENEDSHKITNVIFSLDFLK